MFKTHEMHMSVQCSSNKMQRERKKKPSRKYVIHNNKSFIKEIILAYPTKIPPFNSGLYSWKIKKEAHFFQR